MTETLDLKHKVLIIVKSKQNIIDTASFVVKREFEAALFEDAKEALVAIQQHKPKVVCVSLNVPLSKLPAYCHYIENSLNIPVIVFAEKPDRNTSTLLLKTRMKNTMFGHVTGPSMLLKLRAVIRAQEAKLQAEKNQKEFGLQSHEHEKEEEGRVLNFQQQRSPNSASESNVIKIGDKGDKAGGSKGSHGSLSFQNNNSQNHKNFGFQIGTPGNQSSGYSSSAAYNPTGHGSQPPQFSSMQFQPADALPNYLENWDQPNFDPAHSTDAFNDLDSSWSNHSDQSDSASGAFGTDQNSFDPSYSQPDGNDWNKLSAHGNFNSNFKKQSFIPHLPEGMIVNPNFNLTPHSPQQKAFEELSQFLKGIAYKKEELQHVTGFVKEKVNKVGVIPLVSEEMPGYLVVNYPNEDELVEDFLHEVFKELKAKYPDTSFLSQTPIVVDFNRFLISEWIKEKAQVLVRSARGSNELLVSYVQSDEKIPRLMPSGSELLVFDFDGFCFDHPLTFETYLNLKKNNKVIRYTAKGDVAEEKRFRRIKQIMPDAICIKEKDERNFKQFFLTQSLFCMHGVKAKKEAA